MHKGVPCHQKLFAKHGLRFGAVTFSKRVVCPFMFKKFERAQIEEGVRWFYYTRKRS